MELLTKYHGLRNFNAEDIITFKKGLPGFESLKKFILFPVEENEVFSILHSIEDEKVGLVVTSPFNIVKDYEIELDEKLQADLNIENEQQVLILNTVTLSSVLKNITVNLKAPIVINIKQGLGEQIILDRDKYSIKHPLIKEWYHAGDN